MPVAQSANMQPRTLIVSPNWIGDAVMAQPLLQLLAAGAGQGPIDVMAPPVVAPVWRSMAEVDTVLETPFRHGALQWKERRAFAAMLRERNYTDAYVLPNTLKYALIPWLAGIPHRVGYLGEMRYGLLTTIHHDAKDAPRPMVPFYAALALAPQVHVPGRDALPRPRLSVPVRERQAALARHAAADAAPIVVFAPGAEFGSAKRWPSRHFAQLAEMIVARHPNAAVLLLGSPKDRPACDEIIIAANLSNVRNLAGETSLADAIALIAGAAVVVSNDSGLLHVASALNRPLVALYGPTDPLHAPPFSDVAQSLWLSLPCAPCRQRECPLGHHDCMEKMAPAMAWQPVEAMLGRSIG